MAQEVRNLPAAQETQETELWSLCREDPLEKEMATRSSVLAWKTPWTEEPGGLQSTGSQRVRHDWARTRAFLISTSSFVLDTEKNLYLWSWILGIRTYVFQNLRQLSQWILLTSWSETSTDEGTAPPSQGRRPAVTGLLAWWTRQESGRLPGADHPPPQTPRVIQRWRGRQEGGTFQAERQTSAGLVPPVKWSRGNGRGCGMMSLEKQVWSRNAF